MSTSIILQDNESLKSLHEQLQLISHTNRCLVNQTFLCLVPNCLIMQDVIEHVKTCDLKENCVKPLCVSTRQLINHWNFCYQHECQICSPLKSKENILSLPKLCEHREFEFNKEFYLNQNSHSADENFRDLIFSDVRDFVLNQISKKLKTQPNTEIKELLSCARKIEKSSYEKAQNRDEYFHLIAVEMRCKLSPDVTENSATEVLIPSKFQSKLTDLSLVQINHLKKLHQNPELLEKDQKPSEFWIQELVHACQCKNKWCHSTTCQRIKQLLNHTKNCSIKMHGGCATCKTIVALCRNHAASCFDKNCTFSFCFSIKQRFHFKNEKVLIK